MYFIIYIIIYYAVYTKVRFPIQRLYECSYDNRLYFKWLRKHLKNAFNHLDIYAGILTILSFYVSTKIKLLFLILAFIIIIIDTENIKYSLMINKIDIHIVKENRIIRLLALYILIILLPFIFGMIYSKYKVLFITINLILLVFSYLIIGFINLLIYPLETLIKKLVVTRIIKKAKRIKVNFIGILGRYGKSSLANILKQLINEKVYIINSLDELYKIKFKSNEFIIIKINCDDSVYKSIIFNEILCTKEFDLDDLFILNKLNYNDLYFYKQNKYINKINNEKVFFYGDKNASINLIDYQYEDDSLIYSYNYNGEVYKKNTFILGTYNLYHIIISILLLDNLNIKYNKKLGELKNMNHCLEIKKLKGFTMIDNTYRNNVDSFIEGINILNTMKGTKIIVTSGLSDNNDIIGKHIAKVCDYIILIGERNTRELYDLLIKNKYNKNNIYITNDINESYALISNFVINDDIYVLYENNLMDLYIE